MKFICIGRNYLDHVKEFNSPVPQEPVFFFKPESALLLKRQPFFVPDFSQNVHYEVELLVKICKVGKNIQERFAHTYYNEIGLGIDFTARDIQSKCIVKGLPWEISKAFDGSAVVGHFFPKEKFAGLRAIDFSLKQNGNIVQKGNSANMIFDFDKLISYVSKFVTLKMGDIIFTGTPSGVGPVKINDILEGFIAGEKAFKILVK